MYIYNYIYIVLLQGKHSHAFSDSDVQRNSTEHARISSAGPHLFQMGSSDKASERKHWERTEMPVMSCHSSCCRDTIFAGNYLDRFGPTSENVPLPQSFSRKNKNWKPL